MKCPDCGCEMEEPQEKGEITTCPCCSLELTLEKGKIVPVELEGEDWGE